MIGTLALAVAVMATSATRTDTTVSVQAGTRLELRNFGGSIAVSTWAKDAVRIVAEHSSRVRIRIENSGPRLGIEAGHSRGYPTTVDYQLTVPRAMALDLSGMSTDISVEDSGGEVKIESVHGEVMVSGGTRSVSATSVDGDVHVRGASGRIACNSVNGGVHIERTTGPVVATSVNGEIVLEAIDSGDVDASSVNGTIQYDGSIKATGSYRFSTHNGEVVVTVPERTDATISVATFSGEFSSEFPVQFKEARHGKRFNFTLGNGSARIELESFQGGIRLQRPGSSGRKTGGYRYEHKTNEETKTKHKTSEHKGSEP